MKKYFGFLVGLLFASTIVYGVGNTYFRDVTIKNSLEVDGPIKLKDGSQGTAGQAVVSSDTNGTETWATLGVSGGGTGDTSLTAHYPLIGNGTSAVQGAAPVANSVFFAQNTSSNPFFSTTPTLGVAGTSSGTLAFASSTASTGLVTLANQGTTAANAYTFNLPLTKGSNGQAMQTDGNGNMSFATLTPSGGGTGLATLTAHNVLLGEGTSNVAFAAPGSTANALVSNGASSDPTFQTLGVAGGGTGQTSYTDGQLLIGNTTGNTLALSTLNAGANVTITNGHGTISIAASGSATPSFTMTSQSSDPSPAAVGHHYYLSGASYTFTFPAASVAAQGQPIVVEHAGTSLTQKYTLATQGGVFVTPTGTVASGSYVLTTQGETRTWVSDGTNFRLQSSRTETGPVSSQPTWNNLGTVSNNQCYWTRRGSYAKWNCYVTDGTVAAGLTSFSLPTGMALSTSVTNAATTSGNCAVTGFARTNAGASAIGNMLICTSTSTSNVYVGPVFSSSTQFTPVNSGSGTSLCTNGAILQLEAEFAISDWQP